MWNSKWYLLMSRLAHAFAVLVHQVFFTRIIKSQISKTKLLPKSKCFFWQLHWWRTRRHARAKKYLVFANEPIGSHDCDVCASTFLYKDNGGPFSTTRLLPRSRCFFTQLQHTCRHAHTHLEPYKFGDIFFLFEGGFSPSTCESKHSWLCNV